MVGPLLFICYTAPIQDIIEEHGFSTMMYADDTQLYIAVTPSQRDEVTGRLEICLQEIKEWMNSNHLVLNAGKTEVLHVSSRFKTSSELKMSVCADEVQPSSSVRDLGVIIDKNINMRAHINMVCRNASLALRRIGRIRPFLNKSTTEILVHAFVTSLLDNCIQSAIRHP